MEERILELNDLLEANRIEHEAIKKLHDEVEKANALLYRVRKNKNERTEIEAELDVLHAEFRKFNQKSIHN